MAACHVRNGHIKWGTPDNKAKRVQWPLVARDGPCRAHDFAEFVNAFLSIFSQICRAT